MRDCVRFGVNVMVIGGIAADDDVLIAPGAYVSCDVLVALSFWATRAV